MFLLLLLIVVAIALVWLGLRALRVQYVIPAAARQLSAKGNTAAAIHLLERGLKLWTPLGERGRFDLRFYYAYLLMETRRYADAEAQCRALVSGPHVASLRTKARLRLADCLDGQDRTTEAQQERATVEADTQSASNADLVLERAALLSKQHQYAQATELYQQVLARAGHFSDTVRAEIEVKLALSAWHAGRYPVALEAAETALGRNALSSTMARIAHNMAGLSLTNLNRWEEALPHKEAALALAREDGNPDRVAEALSGLGNVKLQLGELNEAMALASEALPLSLAGRRTSCLLQAEVLQAWGRYDDALAALESAGRAPGLAIPQLAARTQATLALGRARIFVLKGDGKTALEWLEKTTEAFAGDAKLEAWAQAERLCALALLGAREGYNEALTELEARLAALPDDTTTQKSGHSARAVAAQTRGEFRRAREHWERYLALTPCPLDLRRVWYSIGVAEAALENPTEARAAWQEASAPGIESFWTGLAKKRLTELEQSALKNPA
ncbi:tetratricopeptide repeat protein [Armatimonas rosea]|uniref:Tetratricopeptide (TPR) repeat protein n=1 Tax=Armatimonas rosea TaxID=685828 RepID=A0A7W9W7D0_ARMRO|nr:tetratricopeptide repeat protein [Armatimonas rosea]MBB6052339.1 tetratricopeptide (TPR) repeat protein [Armatimonas rosea]